MYIINKSQVNSVFETLSRIYMLLILFRRIIYLSDIYNMRKYVVIDRTTFLRSESRVFFMIKLKNKLTREKKLI